MLIWFLVLVHDKFIQSFACDFWFLFSLWKALFIYYKISGLVIETTINHLPVFSAWDYVKLFIIEFREVNIHIQEFLENIRFFNCWDEEQVLQVLLQSTHSIGDNIIFIITCMQG